MQVHKVSFKSNVNSEVLGKEAKENGVSPFLYTQNPYTKENSFQATSFKLTTALLALIAVGITLINLKRA